MKPFLGIDITEIKKNDILNGEKEFVVQKPSEMLTSALCASEDSTKEVVEKSKLPAPLSAVQFISGLLVFILFIGVINAWNDEPIAEYIKSLYTNAPWIFWVSGMLFATWAILKFLSVKKEKEVLETDETESIVNKFEAVENNIYAELGVPASARDADVLSFFYKIKGDTPKAIAKGIMPTPYLNVEYKIFSDREYLYLANTEFKFAVPLSSLRTIHTVKKHGSVLTWNKEASYKKDEYKQYKLSVDSNGCIHFKQYHILEFEHCGEAWGIYFPSYELPTFEAVTNLKAE